MYALTTLMPIDAISASGATRDSVEAPLAEERILCARSLRSFCCLPARFGACGPGKRIKRRQASACAADGGQGARAWPWPALCASVAWFETAPDASPFILWARATAAPPPLPAPLPIPAAAPLSVAGLKSRAFRAARSCDESDTVVKQPVRSAVAKASRCR
jgi:hypothetical protein